MPRLRQLIVLLACCAVLAACNTTRLAYNQGDRLIAWRAAAMLQLDRGQRQEVRDEVRALRAWQRAVQLPQVRDDLHYLIAALDPAEGGVSVNRPVADFLIARANRHTADFTACLMPAGVRLLRRLDDAQLAHLRKELEQSTEARIKAIAEQDEAEWREGLVEDMRSTLREWIGTLDEAQVARIKAWAQARESTPKMWLEHRDDWLPELFALLEARHDEDFTERLKEWMRDYDRRRPEVLRRAAEADRELWIGLMLDLERMLGDQQRERLLSQLRRYADDAAALAAHQEADAEAVECLPAPVL